MQRVATLGRWLFHVTAAVSLLSCLIFGGLWARSAGHFEMVTLRYVRWPQETEMRAVFAELTWYGTTLRLAVKRDALGPEGMRTAKQQQTYLAQVPPGLIADFAGEVTTSTFNAYPEGFQFQRSVSAVPGYSRSSTILSVRAWLPTLLAAVLPAIWFVRYRRRQGTLWRVGLRELFVVVTLIAVGTGGALWLMK